MYGIDSCSPVYMGWFNFENQNYVDLDFTGKVEGTRMYLLSMTHNGHNNNNLLFLLSGFINKGFQCIKKINGLNFDFVSEATAIDRNIIRITLDQTRYYQTEFYLTII